MIPNYLSSVRKQFEYYKMLGEKAMAQVPDDKLYWRYNEESNSIAMIVHHLWGNMRSRWTDFLTSDGEKQWRNRDAEFDTLTAAGRQHIMQQWNEGWQCLFDALDTLSEDDLAKTIYIRNMGHTVADAINRQLAHYPYHVGQIVFTGKMVCADGWASLSIPRGNSTQYNTEKFAQDQHIEHYTDEFLKK